MLAVRSRDERVSRITGILNSHHAALVDETADLLANEDEWVGPGVWSIENYLQWRAGVSASTARQLATIARRVEDLPVCMAAFRRGEFTLDQMASIARRSPRWIDSQICDLGVALTVNQLNRVLRDYPFPAFDADDGVTTEPTDAAPTDAEPPTVVDDDLGNPDVGTDASVDPPTADEYCSYGFGDDGVFRLHLATDFETGSTIDAALNEAHDRLFQAGQQSVSAVDAFRELMESSLESIIDAGRAARFKTSIFLDVNASATDVAGWNVPHAIRQHLTCDGLLSPIFVDQSVPVSVGRTQRIVPDRTRTLIERRDGGCCSVPGCTRSAGLDVHHIVHWENQGATDTWNLVLICSHHHRQHHRGLLGITGDADLPADADGAVVFTDRNGRRILPSGATPIAPMGPTRPSAARYAHPVGERLDPGSVHFSSPTSVAADQPHVA